MVKIPDWIEVSNQRLENLQAWAEQRHLPVSLSLLDTPITKLFSNGLQSIANPLLSLTMSTVGSATSIVFTIDLEHCLLNPSNQFESSPLANAASCWRSRSRFSVASKSP